MLRTKLEDLVAFQKIHYPTTVANCGSVNEQLAALTKAAAKIKGCVVDTISLLHASIRRGDRVLADRRTFESMSKL